MTSDRKNRARSASIIALSGALGALIVASGARAADDSNLIRELMQPTNFIELGALYVSESSAKFGEYNGLDKRGTYFIGNFQLYGNTNPDTAFRWRVEGTDLGLDTRSIRGDVGEQGRYRITFGYDQIPRNYSDSYQTIWNGAGSTSLTLPAGYPAAASRLSVTSTSAGLLSNWNNTQAPNAITVGALVASVAAPIQIAPMGITPPHVTTNSDMMRPRFSSSARCCRSVLSAVVIEK